MIFETAKKHLHLICVLLLLPSYLFGDDRHEKVEWISADTFYNYIKKDIHRHEPAGINEEGFRLYIGRTKNADGHSLFAYNPRKKEFDYINLVSGAVEKVKKADVEALKHCPGALGWARRSVDDDSIKDLPRNVILGGFHPTTEANLYVCRGRTKKEVVPGQYNPDTKKGCQIINGGKEEFVREFEIAQMSLIAVGFDCIKA